MRRPKTRFVLGARRARLGRARAPDGHTYERAAIEAWLSASPTSPKTGEVLESTTLIPNHSVRQLIDAFHQAATDACGADETKAPS